MSKGVPCSSMIYEAFLSLGFSEGKKNDQTINFCNPNISRKIRSQKKNTKI